jgi:hypothetical protein
MVHPPYPAGCNLAGNPFRAPDGASCLALCNATVGCTFSIFTDNKDCW